jgi:hypothetical protein
LSNRALTTKLLHAGFHDGGESRLPIGFHHGLLATAPTLAGPVPACGIVITLDA